MFDKETVLECAEIVQRLVALGESGEIEETLRRWAASLPAKSAPPEAGAISDRWVKLDSKYWGYRVTEEEYQAMLKASPLPQPNARQESE